MVLDLVFWKLKKAREALLRAGRSDRVMQFHISSCPYTVRCVRHVGCNVERVTYLPVMRGNDPSVGPPT